MENIIFQLLIIKKLSEKDALTYIENWVNCSVVVKKDGLAAGKVIIADTIEAARSAIEIMYGDEEEGTVVFETFL